MFGERNHTLLQFHADNTLLDVLTNQERLLHVGLSLYFRAEYIECTSSQLKYE